MEEKGRTYQHATHERENRKNEIIHTEKGEKDDRPLDLYVWFEISYILNWKFMF